MWEVFYSFVSMIDDNSGSTRLRTGVSTEQRIAEDKAQG